MNPTQTALDKPGEQTDQALAAPLDALERLTNALLAAQGVRKDFQAALKDARNRHALRLTVAPPLIMLAVFYAWLSGTHSSWPIVLSAVVISLFCGWFLGLALYAAHNSSWERGHFARAKQASRRRALARFEPLKAAINQDITDILHEDCLEHPILPSDLMSVQNLFLLRRYIDSNQAVTLDEALYEFNLDLRNQRTYSHMGNSEELFERARAESHASLDELTGPNDRPTAQSATAALRNTRQ